MYQFSRIVVVGSGYEGTALANHIRDCGFEVLLSGRRSQAELQHDADSIIPGSSAISMRQIVKLDNTTTLVIIAIPLSGVPRLNPCDFAGKVVIDVMNFWPKLDTSITELSQAPRDTSLFVQKHLSQSIVVKTLNHLSHLDIGFDARPQTEPRRRALGIASDEETARSAVATFIDKVGYTPVDVGELRNGRFLAPGTEIFQGGWRSPEQMIRILTKRSGYPSRMFSIEDTMNHTSETHSAKQAIVLINTKRSANVPSINVIEQDLKALGTPVELVQVADDAELLDAISRAGDSVIFVSGYEALATPELARRLKAESQQVIAVSTDSDHLDDATATALRGIIAINSSASKELSAFATSSDTWIVDFTFNSPSTIILPGGKSETVGTFEHETVNCDGVNEAFIAGLLNGLTADWELPKAVRFGTYVASGVAEQEGASLA
ncbi:NAD(P)-binding domain-containing protein [Arcanobacterium ihumii]|uniref:NAD(P)-binding domain-containing protein n=1 Tax=Arcanobacterium ihumii TaxID=2138162 RepID=UPI000F53EB5D|nr:NAD(P)-binding domain-containing protein [Arcanobacterium ihumii]